MSKAVNVGLIIMVVFVGAVAAATIPVTNDLPLQTNTGFTVTLDQPGTFAGGFFPAGGDTISLSSGTVTAAGSGALTVQQGGDLSGSQTVLTSIDVSSTTAEVDPTDKPQFDLSGDVTALTVQSSITADDGNDDFTYTSTGNFDLTLRGVTASADIVALDSAGQLLGSGTSDGSGTVTLTMTTTGTQTAQLVVNPAPTVANLAPDGTTETDPRVTLSVDVDDASFSKLGSDSLDVVFKDSSGTQIGTTQTVTGAQTVTQLYDLTAAQNGQKNWSVEVTDQYGTTTTSATQTFTLAEPAPVVTNETPADNSNVNDPPLTLSVDVTDAGLGDYDTVTVTFKDASDNSTIGTDTLTANGTASVTWSDPDTGANQWYVEAADTFGSTTQTANFTVTIPEVLTLRDVNDPNTVLTSPTIDATVRFYESETGDTAVYPRTPQNGQIDMQGLPADQEFVVGVVDSAGNYAQRLTLLNSIFDQQEIYLLNTSADTAVATLVLQDRTGEFETGATSVQIERSVNTTDSPAGEEEYVTVAGDVIGTQLTFSTTLEQDVRYRVSVENDQGDRRNLGSFVLQGDRVINLIISGKEVGVPIPPDEPVLDVSQSIDDQSGDKSVSLSYIDAAQKTESVTIRVVNADNSSDVLDVYNATAGPYGTVTYQQTFTGADADKILIANVTATRQGEQVTLTKPFGVGMFPIDIPMSQEWKQIFGIGFLITIGAIFSRANARIGALVLPGVAALLYVTGILNGAITLLAIGMAFTVAVLINLAFGGRGVLQ
jgi:methionine-rich copper-binding protein CopC